MATLKLNSILRIQIAVFIFLLFAPTFSFSQEKTQENTQETTQEETQRETLKPIEVNGDVVEYSTLDKKISATGNVSVIYKDTTLTCDKLTVDSGTKEGVAEGNVRMDDAGSVIEGRRMVYNFNTKQGVIMHADFRSTPYFGKGRKIDKPSDEEFIVRRGYMTSCSLDDPHFKMKFRKMNFFPGDKVKTRDGIFYAGKVPVFYVPAFNHSLKDPLMHVQFMGGKNKQLGWGMFLLSAWRFQLTDNITTRIYADYRESLGAAEGFGVNYKTTGFGKGDFKYYYTQERSVDFKEEKLPSEFQRYFIRLRHQWDIDEGTKLSAEYYKIVDSKRALHGPDHNFLKDYFPREYLKDSPLPGSYLLLHHNFNYSSLDISVQKRVNRWYSATETLPEIQYTLPSIQIANTPFYLENQSSYVNHNEKSAVPSDSWNDVSYNALTTNNKISLPARLAFLSLTPSASADVTYTDKSTYGATLATTFSGGTDISAKFYRIFDVKTDFLGLDINLLRH
ncbi:LPS-assembly protein LptD, partial [Candidatus Omnitrophota bacterium]